MKKALLLLFLTVANIASVGQSNSIKPTKTQLLAHLKNIRGMVQKALMDVNNDEFIIESLGLNDDSIFYELAYDVYHELYNTDFIKKKMEKDVETYYDLIINDMIPGESITEENQESLLIDLIDTFEMNLDKADTIMEIVKVKNEKIKAILSDIFNKKHQKYCKKHPRNIALKCITFENIQDTEFDFFPIFFYTLSLTNGILEKIDVKIKELETSVI